MKTWRSGSLHLGKNKEEFKKRMAEAHGSKVAGAFFGAVK